MHTFFINTSGKELQNYSDIFEIQHETRRLVPLACPLADWNDAERGYKACVHKMGDLIDSYKDINNDFNLVIYVDLLAYELYTSIPAEKHRQRYACIRALHSVLKHYIKETLVRQMDECGREPKEVLIIFEENTAPKDKDERTEDGRNLIRSYTREVLGLPSEGETDRLVYGTAAEGETLAREQLCNELMLRSCSCIGEGVLCTYPDLVEILFEEAESFEASAEPIKRLLDRVIDLSDKDDESVFSVAFITNRRAGVVNKQEMTRRNLRLYFYILSCVEDETIFDKGASERSVKEFPELDWDKVAANLRAKKRMYQTKHREIQSLSDSFSKIKPTPLAPKLIALDHRRFALDEFGKRDKTFELVDVEDTDEKTRKEKAAEKELVGSTSQKAVEVRAATGRNLFGSEYKTFDYKGNAFAEGVLGKKATPEQYILEAQRLRQHHLDYLHRLKTHISDRLSNYAGRSAENEPALLRKRKVSVAEEDFEDTAKDYPYAATDRPEETKKLNTVKDVAEEAYTSAVLDYMEFCAGRSVAVTDIEELCNWFVTRIHQITESLRKIKTVAVGLFFALLVLYIPFAVLQWEAITANAMTVAVALASVAIPLFLLYFIFAVVSRLQRKKYRKAWDEFKEKSDEVLRENASAAEQYDRLLTVYIPTLRWVYEYRLDVKFYEECCKMARAKVGHHLQKLHDRTVTVGNIIEDLEMDASESARSAKETLSSMENAIDYNVAFCSCEKNRRFYSVIDTDFLKSVCKESR